MSEFAGATYRPGIPEAAVRLVSQTVAAKQHPVLLDLGSGTGQVPAALLEAFAEIDVVERDPGMLAEAETSRPCCRCWTAARPRTPLSSSWGRQPLDGPLGMDGRPAVPDPGVHRQRPPGGQRQDLR